jgi:PAS domain S-box-containing protein
MTTELRETGISVLGGIPWGTHFCHFYETRQDLLDILIPFFRAGLEKNEFCLWVVADPFTAEEARDALRRGIPEAEHYLSEGRIEVIPHTDWYLKGGGFDAARVVGNWNGRLDEALNKGFDGLRGNGTGAGLVEKYREAFVEYDRALDESLAGKRMLLLCSYPLSEVDAAGVFDVVQAHEVAVVRRGGAWEVIENAELKRARREIERLNERLEQRVVERTRELAATNEELKREIARREQVEAAEIESRQLYEALVQSIDGIVCEMDGQTFSVTFVSRKAEEILGYPVERWLTEPDFWLNRLHPDDRARTVEAKAEAVARREGRRLVYRMIAADGRVVWFRDILTVTVRRDGRTLLRGVKVDITELRRVEDALRESEERFRRAFVSNPAANVICSFPDGRFLYVNDAFVRTFGYAPEEVVGKTSVELGLWPDPGEREELVRMARGGELLRRYEARLRSKSGDLVDTLFYTEMIELAGAPHLLVMVSDITERKRVEELLRTREQHFRTIIENSADGIALFSPDGSIHYASPSTPRVLGYTPEELVSFNAFDLVHPEDHEAVRQGINAILGCPAASADVQVRVRHKDGEWRWLEGAFTNMIDEPHVGAIVNNFRDITERKRAEDENRRLVSVLSERVKELTALHNAARVLQQELVDTVSVLRELAELLPPAFQYPEIMAARVRLGPVEATTVGFASSPSALRADCMTANGQPCSIEVVYTVERPPAAEGPFLAEERRLINTLADMLRAAYDRRQAEEQLRQTTGQLRSLSASLRSAREEEAARIAREIHDELGAALSSLRWDLEEVGEVVSEAADEPRLAALRRKIADMMGLTNAAINTVRRITSELRPTALDQLGLAEAIEWQAQQFQERTGIVVNCDCALESDDLTQEQSTAIFRIFQEALTNVLRHAQATRVDITAKKEADEFVLTVSDNGRGITEEEQAGLPSLGLLGMRERANLIGGKIQITGVEGKGTDVTLRVPISG